MLRWRLDLEAGGGYVLPSGVTVVGRSSARDIVFDDPSVSRRQLLLHTRADGVELVRIGRRTTSCNGVAFEGEHLAKAGDRLAIGGRVFASLRAVPADGQEACWLLRLDGGPAIGLPRRPFSIGGGAGDDLRIAGWPGGALRLYDVDRVVLIELSAAQLLAMGERPRFDVEGLARLIPDRTVSIGGHTLEIVATPPQRERIAKLDEQPTALHLERYERGGALHLERGGLRRSVYLTPRRFALLRALVSPPPPLAAGEGVEVEALCRAVWPRDASKDETDLNVLVYRVRRALLLAGLDADEFVLREREQNKVCAPIAGHARAIVD
ncbi:FHA domain-containing protein [Pseudenhygromyxa sp. WMMC2535]|uniref:FHA domain-containing protein n=1 Tax=Pseudenhygromyxa sp. WMMC2535 TaxID=2712867 RepID=UPI001553164F|nr:FHA domain-containing protein [Pseudenhygromyxa sp. WMMC2535]NVB43303.1 FHA domain-containing protein [Pseudenhygromyxa sp. WMMC2535]